MLAPFQSGIGLRALLEVLAAGAACGPLGVWILLLRQTYAAESMSHAMLPGLVAAALIGAPLVLGAAGGVLLAAGCIALAAREARAWPEVAVGVAVTALAGLGAALALSPASPPRIGELLFGNLLGVDGGEVVVAAAIAIVVCGVLAAAHRPLALAAFDPAVAPSLGGRPGAVRLLLLALLGLTTVAAVQALGNLLVFALLVAPAAAALTLAPRLALALPLAALLAWAAGIAGLEISYHLDLAAGASVALCAVALVAVALIRA